MNHPDHIRSLQPLLHEASEHHAVHGIEHMTDGDVLVYRTKVDAVRKSIRDLREFQVQHSPFHAELVSELLERDRFPSTDEQQ